MGFLKPLVVLLAGLDDGLQGRRDEFVLVAAIVLMIAALGGVIDGCPAGWVAALMVFVGLGGVVWLIWRSEER